jgi:hypothetical protein
MWGTVLQKVVSSGGSIAPKRLDREPAELLRLVPEFTESSPFAAAAAAGGGGDGDGSGRRLAPLSECMNVPASAANTAAAAAGDGAAGESASIATAAGGCAAAAAAAGDGAAGESA